MILTRISQPAVLVALIVGLGSTGCGRLGFELGDLAAGGSGGTLPTAGVTGEAGDSASGDGDGDGDASVGGAGGDGDAGGTGGSGGAGGMTGGSGGTSGTGGDGDAGVVDVCVGDRCASDVDRCASDPDKTSPGICGCGTPDDADDDADGTPDCSDLCPDAPDVLPTGACGCAAADDDSDGDGIENCHDACPDDGGKTAPAICGCGIADDDADDDTMPDCADGCANDANKVEPGVCGCGVVESTTDTDGDDEPDCIDACNGVDDASYVPNDSCGVGYCLATNTASTCVAGLETLCAPGAPLGNDDATCDSVDDDCDATADEEYPSTPSTCGVGACFRNGLIACVSGSVTDSCVVGTAAASDATCDGADDDCDSSADEEFVPFASTCGVGACEQTGTVTCVSGSTSDSCVASAPAGSDATCDGIDDDCDGTSDEDYGSSSSSCGEGACVTGGTISCVDGSVTDSCMAGSGAADDTTCDGVDDDCDGSDDEDYVPVPTSCGVGACAASGSLICSGGSTSNTCNPGTPAPNDASCNGIDNDCNGTADEDYVNVPSNCGVGACASTGTITCSGGSTSNSCSPGTPAANDAVCDGIDNDCSGAADEDYVPTPTSCGVGACAASGSLICSGGSTSNTCNPGTPAANDASCNGIDNDCNGTADEDYVNVPSNCGVGACASTGTITCSGGTTSNSCTAGTPAPSDASCDGIDQDCSGAADEDYVNVPSNCGVGACASTGTITCSGGSTNNSCMAGTPAPNDASCNGIDNDCSGAADEDYVPMPTSCGVGTCAATGSLICSGGNTSDTCTAGSPRPGLDDPTWPGNGADDNCNGSVDEDSVQPCDTTPRTFEAGVHTNITVPAGCTTATVRLWGGAGAAGGESHNATGGRGGAGGYAQSTLTISGPLTLWVGNGGASSCSAGGANAGAPTTYNGGAGGTSTGTAGRDLVVAGGGTGATTGGTGFAGARGHYGGGGGGGAETTGAVHGPTSAGAGGGGAASAVLMNGTTVMVAGGGGGGGGAAPVFWSSGIAGGNGGQGCGGNGATGGSNRAGGGGGGGICIGTTTTQGSAGTPANSGLVPAPRARGTTTTCGVGGHGYATVTFGI